MKLMTMRIVVDLNRSRCGQSMCLELELVAILEPNRVEHRVE